MIGAALAFIANTALRVWQYNRDQWIGRVDWFCENVERAADLGTEYWSPSDEGIDGALAGKILGREILLDGILATLSNKLLPEDIPRLHARMSDFRNALTGGAFQSSAVTADLDRAREIQSTASDLLIAVRRAADGAISPAALLGFPSRQHTDEPS